MGNGDDEKKLEENRVNMLCIAVYLWCVYVCVQVCAASEKFAAHTLSA